MHKKNQKKEKGEEEGGDHFLNINRLGEGKYPKEKKIVDRPSSQRSQGRKRE